MGTLKKIFKSQPGGLRLLFRMIINHVTPIDLNKMSQLGGLRLLFRMIVSHLTPIDLNKMSQLGELRLLNKIKIQICKEIEGVIIGNLIEEGLRPMMVVDLLVEVHFIDKIMIIA